MTHCTTCGDLFNKSKMLALVTSMFKLEAGYQVNFCRKPLLRVTRVQSKRERFDSVKEEWNGVERSGTESLVCENLLECSTPKNVRRK